MKKVDIKEAIEPDDDTVAVDSEANLNPRSLP